MFTKWVDIKRILISIIITAIAGATAFFYCHTFGIGYVAFQNDLWTWMTFLCFTAAVYFVSILFAKLHLSLMAKLISMFFYFFLLIWSAQGLIHAIFLTELAGSEALFVPLLLAVVLSILITLLLPDSGRENTPVLESFKAYFESRTTLQWVMRIVTATVLLFTTYFLLNYLMFPFIEPYYSMSSSAFILSENSFMISSAGMFVHALLMLIVFLPLFALWKGSKSSLLFWLGFPLFLLIAMQSFVLYSEWPLGFRFPLFVHLTLTMYIQAIILVQLFYKPKGEEIEDQLLPAIWSW
ncbi:hypothetical protein [Salisediminibacterium beveridgei]|uniref:Uncharacterized protein n=1 Tax=Salisediminibacterium beveridgei TaxID=632773 RepID=A0A1D7QV45_9BACI|nr:hypothetical protein [Salisediminibacterium beveridgei]AOM82867.1 hypothetical protein BBEV_1504 [Salisediminibacterium beveridgei]